MATLGSLEKNLQDIFVGKLPPLPVKGKKFIVKNLPYISVVVGTLTLIAAWELWHWAHVANNLINYANEMSRMYGGEQVATTRMNAGIWLALIVLVVEAVMYLMAFQPTKDHKKSGWNLIFYAALVNLAYGAITIFTDYNGFGSFLGTIISTGVGLYLLFQIRESYLGTQTSRTEHTTKK
jgi:hypothetical protein